MLTIQNYIAPILYVMAPLLVGLILKHIKFLEPLTKPAFRLLDIIVIWIILPAIVFVSIARLTIERISGLGNILVLALIGLGVCFVLSVVISNVMKLGKENSTSLVLNSAFMNVTHLGLPVVYAITGAGMLGPASLYAVAIGIPNLLFGIALTSSIRKKHVNLRFVLKHVLTFPAAAILLVALLFVGFRAHLPNAIQEFFDAYLAKPFFAAMLLLVGYHMPIVDPRKHLLKLASVGAIRFVICPIITYLTILALGLSIAGDITPKPALIMSIMPPAIFNVILAHSFKLDMRFYGAAVFYLTFISLFIALPILIHLTF